MIPIKRNDLTYFIRKESVTVQYRSQFISFNSYDMQNKQRFTKFVDTIVTSKPGEIGCVNDLYGLAREFEIKASAGHNPNPQMRIVF